VEEFLIGFRLFRSFSGFHLMSCTSRGLPSRPSYLRRWWALTPPFHPYSSLFGPAAFKQSPAFLPGVKKGESGLLSVALSLGRPWHQSRSLNLLLKCRPTLRCPDFPLLKYNGNKFPLENNSDYLTLSSRPYYASFLVLCQLVTLGHNFLIFIVVTVTVTVPVIAFNLFVF